MKIINTKGKLFGFINVIDFLILLLLLMLLPTFYYIFRMITEDPPIDKGFRILPVVIRKVPIKDLALVKVGDKEFDSSNEISAELIKIKKIDFDMDSIETGDKRGKILYIDSSSYMLYAELKVNVVELADQFVYKDLFFKDNNYIFNENKRFLFITDKYKYYCEVRQFESFDENDSNFLGFDAIDYNGKVRFEKLTENDIIQLQKGFSIYNDSVCIAKFIKEISIEPDTFEIIHKNEKLYFPLNLYRMEALISIKIQYTGNQIFWQKKDDIQDLYLDFIINKRKFHVKLLEMNLQKTF